MKAKITKKTKFSEVLEGNPEMADFLMEKGMFCIGCPMAMEENLEDGALAHGIKPEKLIKEINKKLEKS